MLKLHPLTGLLLLAALSVPVYAADELDTKEKKAIAQCDKEIGVSVPDFDCDKGTLVPETNLTDEKNKPLPLTDPRNNTEGFSKTFNYAKLTCDRPNVLNGQCDPGSKFQVLINSPEAFVVAHCRRRGGVAGGFADIAVIQHNKISGATCFYQNGDPDASKVSKAVGLVKAPSKTKKFLALSPADDSCLGCHDNGPLIRSPYLAQIQTGKDVMPGAGDNRYNKGQPYYWVGDQEIKLYEISPKNTDQMCIGCHHFSASAILADGEETNLRSSLFKNDFDLKMAEIATKEDQLKKNVTSAAAPMWMPPNTEEYSEENFLDAQKFTTCGQQFADGEKEETIECNKPTLKNNRPDIEYSLVSPYGKCISTDFTAQADPVKGIAFSAVCDGDSSNQQWIYNKDGSKRLTTKNDKGELRCLTRGTIDSNKSAVVAKPCKSNNADQQWEYNQKRQITDAANGTKCLQVTDTQITNTPTKVELKTCQGTESQYWALQDIKFNNLANFSDPTKLLNINPDQAVWSLERVAAPIVSGKLAIATYRLRNKNTSAYLSLNQLSNPADSASTEVGALTEQWIVTSRPKSTKTFQSGGDKLKAFANKSEQNVVTLQSLADPNAYLNLDDDGNLSILQLMDDDAKANPPNTAQWILLIAK